jgi:hypothetical protein
MSSIKMFAQNEVGGNLATDMHQAREKKMIWRTTRRPVMIEKLGRLSDTTDGKSLNLMPESPTSTHVPLARAVRANGTP